jgi:hypothetical protein
LGKDDKDCGNSSYPCLSLNYGLNQLNGELKRIIGLNSLKLGLTCEMKNISLNGLIFEGAADTVISFSVPTNFSSIGFLTFLEDCSFNYFGVEIPSLLGNGKYVFHASKDSLSFSINSVSVSQLHMTTFIDYSFIRVDNGIFVLENFLLQKVVTHEDNFIKINENTNILLSNISFIDIESNGPCFLYSPPLDVSSKSVSISVLSGIFSRVVCNTNNGGMFHFDLGGNTVLTVAQSNEKGVKFDHCICRGGNGGAMYIKAQQNDSVVARGVFLFCSAWRITNLSSDSTHLVYYILFLLLCQSIFFCSLIIIYFCLLFSLGLVVRYMLLV